MIFFLDHCVPRSVGRKLAVAGHQAIELIECLPADSADPLVIGKAGELDAVLVSLNGDFADITAYLAHPDRGYFKGKLLIAEPHRIRIRT